VCLCVCFVCRCKCVCHLICLSPPHTPHTPANPPPPPKPPTPNKPTIQLYCDEFCFRRNEKFFRMTQGTTAENTAARRRAFQMVCEAIGGFETAPLQLLRERAKQQQEEQEQQPPHTHTHTHTHTIHPIPPPHTHARTDPHRPLVRAAPPPFLFGR
jgi:hypothetical protein